MMAPDPPASQDPFGKRRTAASLAAGMALFLPAAAYAYVVPGAGSIAVQTFLGIAAGIAVLLRMGWHALVSLVRPTRHRSRPRARR